jgi:hypothetical protein
MDESTRNYLSVRHAVEEWSPISPGLITAPEPTSVEVDGWSLVRSRPLRIPEARTAWTSLWKPPGGRELVLLRVDLIDTVGPNVAREELLRLLGEFESPTVQRQLNVGAGDVAFGPPDGTALLFLRANIVVALRNAEREVVVVTAYARHIDEQLRARLDQHPKATL